ncbi:hypothetical protein AB1Y20_021707 [Prymnesium parvum]|uniref:Uncharacterized protein n=1 Tax=Prymnesium parvum TaxID=97485 RepID=A0AB34JK85_PRYPA
MEESWQAVDNSAEFAGDAETRDDDGTIDRVRDPPEELLPVLAAIKEKCLVERIDIHSVFAEAGASPFGVLATTKFVSSLCVNLPRFLIDAEVFDAIIDAYGVGYRNPVGIWESIAWLDFCEDVRNATDTTEGQVATRLARVRSAHITFKSLASRPEDLGDLTY